MTTSWASEASAFVGPVPAPVFWSGVVFGDGPSEVVCDIWPSGSEISGCGRGEVDSCDEVKSWCSVLCQNSDCVLGAIISIGFTVPGAGLYGGEGDFDRPLSPSGEGGDFVSGSGLRDNVYGDASGPGSDGRAEEVGDSSVGEAATASSLVIMVGNGAGPVEGDCVSLG
jgi:hypothetical protein